MSSDNSLDQILDGTASQARSEPTSPPATEETREPERQESPKGDTESAPPAAAAPQKADPAEKLVPIKALEDERRKRQELERWRDQMERQLRQGRQAPQQQTPPVDWFTNPEEAAARLAAEFEERRLNDRANLSERAAIKSYGQELVEEARQWALEQGVARHFFVNSPDPYDDVVKHYRKSKFLSEVGDDPDSYKQKLREQLLAEMGQQQPAPSNQQPAPQQTAKAPVPKSLAGARSEQPRASNGQWASAPSLSQLID